MPKQLFDDWPTRYQRWFETPIGALVKRVETELILDMFSPPPGATLLDAGCGSGIFTTPFVERGARVTGIDVSVGMLGRAVETLPASQFNAVAASLVGAWRKPVRG